MERFKKFLDRFTRPSRKWTDILPIAALLSIAVLFLGVFMSLAINAAGLDRLIEMICEDESLAEFMGSYAGFLGIWLAVLLVVVIFRANRPMLKSFGHNRKGNTLKGYLIGLLLGFGTNSFCVLMSLLMNDIKLSFFGFDPLILIAFLIAITIQSGAEELVDRFYLYQKLRRRYISPWVAILGNSLVFAAKHILNPGFTLISGMQIFMVGLIFSLLVYYYDGLWIAIAFHTAWNFTQNIIYGLPNSGIVSVYSIFNLEAASARNGFFYNVNFGVEGSIGAVLVLALTGLVIRYINRDKPELNDNWANYEEIRPVDDDTAENVNV